MQTAGTVTEALSFVVGLMALSAFFVVAIIMTILLAGETELPETQYHRRGGLE